MKSSTNTSEILGTKPVKKLLFSQSAPAAVGFMVMSLNMVVDTFFVGRYIGELAIGAISVIFPISFLLSAVGMSIGIGGGSIVSRALGSNDEEKAQLSFNNQISLTLFLAFLIILIGVSFSKPILTLFGAKGAIFPLADIYFSIVLIGIPFLAISMMANNNLRAEGKPKIAMIVLLIPSIVNIILDYILIDLFDLGMSGAAWATTVSYLGCAFYIFFFYLTGKGQLKVLPAKFKLNKEIVTEIFKLGSVNLVRQGTLSLLAIILNTSLFYYGNKNPEMGGETAISVYGLASRLAMFAFFPLIGIAQGFMPIVGYNFGAKKFERVKETINYSLIYGFLIASVICFILTYFSPLIPHVFTHDQKLIHYSPDSIFWLFITAPTVVFHLIGPSYYQALGKALPALLLTITKQGLFLIPLVVVLPLYFGIDGIWYSFPISDVLSAITCYYFLRKGVKKLA